MSHNDRLGLLGNGSEGFPLIWSDAHSGIPNVPTKSATCTSLENVSHLIPPSKSNEELGKICALPSSQMGRREISKFPLDGVSRLKTLSEAAPSLSMNAPFVLKTV
jgi:hypothetical protein